MKSYQTWIMENNGMNIMKAEIVFDGVKRLLIKTAEGSFDFELTPEQAQDLTQKMGSMAVAPPANQVSQQGAVQQ